jgi:hypothetical protein
MKKLEGEPSEAAQSVAIGAIALKARPSNEEQFVRLALARDWAEFLARESEGRPVDNLPALKQNATKAIKFDPQFAFGFYVLGRVATLEGLDGHGVRFFRRALGIDPNLVEASRHLQLLTGSTPELPVAEEPPTVPNLEVEDVQTFPNAASPMATRAKAITAALEPPWPPPPPVPVVAVPPPVPAATVAAVAPPAISDASIPGPSLQLSAERSGSGMRVLSWALVIAGVGGIGAALWGRGHVGGASEHVGAASASASAPASASASASAPAPASASAPASAPASASAVPAASAVPIVPLVPGPNEGVVKTRWSTGHRLFVDGLVVGQTPAQVLVACGTHVIKVGSAGREQSLDVPCGATLTVDP